MQRLAVSASTHSTNVPHLFSIHWLWQLAQPRQAAAAAVPSCCAGAPLHRLLPPVLQDDVRWLVHVLERVTSSPSVYTLLGALEQVMDNERIAFLEELEGRLLTRPRLARLGAVCIMVLTPDVLLQRFEGRASPEQQVAGPVLANWRGPEGDDGRDKLRVGAAARLVAGARQFWTDERIDRWAQRGTGRHSAE